MDTSEYDAGMGTTPGMWEMLSDILAENSEKLPDSLNTAIYALREGKARVICVKSDVDSGRLWSGLE